MRYVLRRGGAVGALVLAFSGSLWAGGGSEPSERERAVHASLKDVINQGAFLFNKFGDHYGCYRTYDGALRAIRPLLVKHADLQKQIDEALEAAEQMPNATQRAFALRKVLDAVRNKLIPPDPLAAKGSLWERLGGEANVRKVVHDFVVAAGGDPKVNITRDGKLKLDDKKVALLEQRVVEYISSITGGPLKYTGKSMKDAHKGMGITDAEFDATAGHFIRALEKYGAKPEDIKTIVTIVGSGRQAIVEKPGKSDGDGKPEPKPLPPGTGKVIGKVTFTTGAPAPSGYLTLVSEEKTKISTYIHPDGTYAFKTPVPKGNYVVTIEPALKDDPTAVKNVPIPAYYRDMEKSPIRVEIRAGENEINIQLVEPGKK